MRTIISCIFLIAMSFVANFATSNQNRHHMKRFILMAAFCLVVAAVASAEIKYQSINNVKATNIVLVDENALEKVEITDAVLYNNGREYPAKEIRCDNVKGVITYKLKFKRLTVFKNCKVILTVNGKKVTVDIQKNMIDR